MVESLAELKERINSFHNAETQISSVSANLVELIEATSAQVEKASQILEMAATVGIPEFWNGLSHLQWYQAGNNHPDYLGGQNQREPGLLLIPWLP